ncbi:hypothetical protein ABEP17_19550 [Priestia flexa]|uniref:Uncharacterized protein n=1 Tax=Priestia veravalensis TaxID=1414648 RepID=A0A0V8JGR3_9BACI|nr:MULTISPECIES: hypothetical protein [Priestia]KSU86138.1 hypothetical protein AS180_20325 [Priestia veravalensis]MBY6088651.1 hypothetical protein [Priestia flexa]MCA1204016.1 hypothetical protein [Priestia flexa]MCP1190173.1 hypothetical protein [Priestia flexa]MED4589609.1 hypothetical protein [Priestia flexa]
MNKLKNKKKFWVLIVIVIAIVCIMGFKFYEYQTKTTDLSGENIDTIYLLDDMKSYETNHRFSISKDVSHPGYKVYAIDNNENKRITVKNENKENTIYRIEAFDSSSKTSKNVSIGTSEKDLISAYGKSYIERSSDQTDKIIEYVDRDKNILLSFFIYKNKVDGINLEVKDF